jgi:hypothetical protein
MVTFYAGDDTTPFDSFAVNGLNAGETLEVNVQWEAKEVDRIRVVVDEANAIPEANDDDNSAEHAVTIAYGEYFGWFDSVRENPLAWIFVIVSIITLAVVATVASKTSIDYGEGAFEEEEDWDDDEEEEESSAYDDEDEEEYE